MKAALAQRQSATPDQEPAGRARRPFFDRNSPAPLEETLSRRLQPEEVHAPTLLTETQAEPQLIEPAPEARDSPPQPAPTPAPAPAIAPPQSEPERRAEEAPEVPVQAAAPVAQILEPTPPSPPADKPGPQAEAAPAPSPEVSSGPSAEPPAPVIENPAPSLAPTPRPETLQPALPEVEARVPDSVIEPVDASPPTVELAHPPRVEAPRDDRVVAVQAADLSGGSDTAVAAFTQASPSAMAAGQARFGEAVDGELKREQTALAAAPPVIVVKTTGEDLPLVAAPVLAPPGEATISDGVTATAPGRIGPVALPAPAPFKANVRHTEKLAAESAPADNAFKAAVASSVGAIQTRDDEVDTSAGARPAVELTAEADPSRLNRQRDDGLRAVKDQRDAHAKALLQHPGQSNIRPRAISKRQSVAISATPTVAMESRDDADVRAYALSPLPADVRVAADAKIARTLTPHLAQARGQALDAAAARDRDKTRQVDTVQQAADSLSAETDSAQRRLVIENRGKVAKLQGEGIAEANAGAGAFSRDAALEQTRQQQAIGDHVATEQGKASAELDKGEKAAEEKKREGEREAGEKKQELEKEQQDNSFWGKVQSAIKKRVDEAITLIDHVFNKIRAAVKSVIEAAKNAAIGLVNAARSWVVDKLNKFRDWAKTQVDKYLKDAFPALAKRINAGIDAVADQARKAVDAIADVAVASVSRLADGLAGALDKVLGVFQTVLKTAVRVVGAVMQGDFAGALRAAVEGACDIAGVDPKTVFNFLDRAGKAIGAILAHPIKFIGDLFGAVGTGISNFAKNIEKHLIEGALGWLTGALPEINLTGPFEFSPKGILKIVLELLGITYDNIKARVIKGLPAAAGVFDAVEKGFPLLARIAVEGPGALWDEVKARMSDLKETVLGSIRSWLITNVIEGGIAWLLSLTNPASAIVKAVMLLYDLVKFLIERYQQIKTFILTVYDAVSDMAVGNFPKVVSGIEDSLAKVLPVLISLLATLLHLGGIAKKVREVLQRVTKPINAIVDKVVDGVIKFARSMLAKGKAAVTAVKAKGAAVIDKIREKFWPKRKFTVDGESHTIYFEERGGRMEPFMRSTPTALADFVAAWEKNAGPDINATKRKHLAAAKATIGEMTALSDKMDKLKDANKDIPAAHQQEMLALQTDLCVSLSGLLGKKSDLAKAVERYKLEGLAGTYAAVPKPSYDDMTGDHQPQAAAIKLLAARPYFKQGPEGEKMRHRADGGHADNAYVVNLQSKRHIDGRTYGSKGASSKADFESHVLAMEKVEGSKEKRRSKAVALLKHELALDVEVMRGVYERTADHEIWKDLNPFVAGTEKTDLVKQIQDQVRRGINIIADQPMDELAG